jgi:hypothetical protein
MIIQLVSGKAENARAAKHSLEALARSWGHEITETPVAAANAAGTNLDDDKIIDPVSVAALVLSIPSTALAVLDLADRITKRRRAKELIDHAAQQEAVGQVTICVMSRSRAIELRTLTPDQLLELLTGENSASDSEQLTDPAAQP